MGIKNTIRYYAGRFIDWAEGLVDEVYLFACRSDSMIVRAIHGLDMTLMDLTDFCYYGTVDRQTARW